MGQQSGVGIPGNAHYVGNIIHAWDMKICSSIDLEEDWKPELHEHMEDWCTLLWALLYGELLGFLKQTTIRVRNVHIRKMTPVALWEWTEGEMLTSQDPESNSETYKWLDVWR